MDKRYEQYGWPGKRIPGSKYVRAYCCVCEAPIRVPRNVNLSTQECAECTGLLAAKILRQTHGLKTEYRPAIQSPVPAQRAKCQPRGA